jgi:hypothetical protein
VTFFVSRQIADVLSSTASFFNILISSFGYSTLQSLLFGAPGGAVVVVAVLLFLWLGDRFKMRCLCGICALLVGMLGMLLIWQLPTHYKVGRLIGYYLWVPFPAPPRARADADALAPAGATSSWLDSLWCSR